MNTQTNINTQAQIYFEKEPTKSDMNISIYIHTYILKSTQTFTKTSNYTDVYNRTQIEKIKAHLHNKIPKKTYKNNSKRCVYIYIKRERERDIDIYKFMHS